MSPYTSSTYKNNAELSGLNTGPDIEAQVPVLLRTCCRLPPDSLDMMVNELFEKKKKE